MRIDHSVTSISWIPSEAVLGLTGATFKIGVAHYDAPPPDHLGPDVETTLQHLRENDAFRFANHLRAFAEFDDDGNVVDAGYTGGGQIGATTVRFGVGEVTVAAFALPDVQASIETGPGWARFRQTAGGRTGVPAPRAVKHPPFVQYRAPIAWSTLELTLSADGTAAGNLVGASPFPRHWVYGHEGELLAKTGLVDFKEWYARSFGKHTPWGDMDSPAFVTEVETALERELSHAIMRGGEKPEIRKLKKGKTLVTQGETGDELYLLLDGMLSVEHDGKELAEIGPGAVVGERAILEGGTRRATLRAVTPCRVAAIAGHSVDREKLIALSAGHRREEQGADA